MDSKRMVIACTLIATSGTHLAGGRSALAGGDATARRATVAQQFTSWSVAASIELAPPGADPNFNTPYNDGCPSASRDGLTLYMASNRPGSMINPVTGLPSQDIWVSRRASLDDPWGEPANVGAPINTPFDDFCPSPMRDGHGFLFVSTKPDGCGGTGAAAADIYSTREHINGGWAEPVNLGCHVNSSFAEASPFFVEYDDGTVELYFSSTRPGGPGAGADSDIYVSVLQPDGSLGAPVPAPGLNTPQDDSRPNLRRDGLEIFFDSTRPGSAGIDLWTSTRISASDPWSLPENLGGAVNTAANETRPWLSWDATTLYFGSTRADVGEGMADWYVTTRERVTGK